MSPLLFVFKNTFEYCFENLDKDNQIYIDKLESDWFSFWNAKGDEIVHSSWSRKYSEYILNEDEEQEHQEESNSKQNKPSPCEVEIKSAENDSKEIETEVDANSFLWQELWNTHNEEVYEKTYKLFAIVHQHHYNFYKPHSEEEFLQDLSYPPESEKEEELEFSDHTEQLLAFGLPTSFGGSNSKYNKIRWNDSSADSFSEEENAQEQNMAPAQRQGSEDQEVKKKKKKNRKLKRMPKVIVEDKSLHSYWFKRFSLFSRFDEGIKLDRESWFSVTPEKVAIHMAERLRCGIIIDAFCGSGGNAIQFAHTCHRVIAIDIDPEKIKNARHNASIYGVADKIEFIIGDFLQLSENLKGDVVFLSPPWGGPKYISQKEYDIEESLKPLGASDLAAKSRLISENIAFFLPKNSKPIQIAKVAGLDNRVEVEHNYLNTRLVGLTAIYGDWLIDKKNL